MPKKEWSLKFLLLMLCMGVTFNYSTVPAWSYDDARDKIISRYLDMRETRQASDGQQSAFLDEPADVKEAYIGQQSRYFVAPSNAPKVHSFDLGYEAYSYSYEEKVDGEKFMSNKGAYSGFDLDYTYRPEMQGAANDVYIDEYRLQGRLALGEVDYSCSGTFSGIKDHMYEMRGLVAKNYILKGIATVSPYLGVGYRYLNDGAEKYTPGGYNRESRYLYLPVGADLRARLRGGWDMAMNLEYDRLIDGEQKSHLEDVDPVVDTLVNKQRDGYGLRGSFKVSKEVNKKVNVFVEPFVRYWNIGNSDLKPITAGGAQVCDDEGCWFGQEPSNQTKEIGVKMGVGF